MCGREKEDRDAFAVWFGRLLLAQHGLNQLWLLAAPLDWHSCIHPGQGPSGAERLCAMPSLPSSKITMHRSLSLALLSAPGALCRRTPSAGFHAGSFHTPSPGSHQYSCTGNGCTRARRQLESRESFITATHTSCVQCWQASRAPSPPLLFLLLLIQVTSLQEPQDFLGEMGIPWALTFPCQGAEQSRFNCKPALLSMVLSTPLTKC